MTKESKHKTATNLIEQARSLENLFQEDEIYAMKSRSKRTRAFFLRNKLRNLAADMRSAAKDITKE